MALEAVDKVVKDDKLMAMFNLNKVLWPAIKKSWNDRQTDLMGRFDFAWDGKNPPKMLEYNADTPSILLESGPVQADWFKAKYPNDASVHQSNYIHPFLKDAMQKISKKCSKVGFAQVS